MRKLFKTLIILVVLVAVAGALYALARSNKADKDGLKRVTVENGSITEKAIAVGQIQPRQKFSIKSTELSGGQMQRVAIARALAMRPDVLLADEPTGNLDSSAGGDIMQLFTQLWEQGRTVVVITHDMSLARRASRIVEIHDSRIVSDSAAVA
jgi:ABC-type lipoprotein export system ATPase subunit